jgi:hypothetical protein
MDATPEENLADRFFSEARAALLDGKPTIDIAPTDILTIAQDASLRATFRQSFRQQINDPELKLSILRYLRDVADSLEDAAEADAANLELIDRAALTPSAAVTVAGIVAIVATGVALGSIALLAGGVFGLGASGAGRTWIRRRSNTNKSSRRKILRLVEDLEETR